MENGKDMIRDYSLIGRETKRAIDTGLAEAEWYKSPVPRAKMRELLIRKDGPAIRDTIIWFTPDFWFGLSCFPLVGFMVCTFPIYCLQRFVCIHLRFTMA